MRILRYGLYLGVLLLFAAAGFVVYSQPGLIPGVEVPAPASFDRALVEKGAELAALGNCHSCHTTPGQADYSGNRPIPTPFGTVYSRNITPAPGTGLGHWPEEAFRRAMREGVSRRGERLYPAFPYDHYAKLTDDDLDALRAFLMTRAPSESFITTNQLPFPLNKRWPLVFWNLAFLDPAPFRPDPRQSAEWNRGAYLVTGIGHCGDCHTPRNLLGGEQRDHKLAGGEGEGWQGPALNTTSPAPVPWDAEHLFAYLRHGWDDQHGAAAGPMQQITVNLGQADEADVRAIATYLAAQHGPVTPERQQRAAAALALAAKPGVPAPAAGEELGASLFTGACASCHAGGSSKTPPYGLSLALSTALNQADPTNAILIILDGIRPPGETAGPWMPRFDAVFTDAQTAALLEYLRAHYTSGPPWSNLETRVRDIRKSRPRA